MRPNISGWGNVQLSVGWSVRLPIGWLVCQSIRLSVTYSLNSSKFDILPIFTKRNWTSKINGVHIRPNYCYSTTWQPQYHSDHNKTTKKMRRILVRQNLFLFFRFTLNLHNFRSVGWLVCWSDQCASFSNEIFNTFKW